MEWERIPLGVYETNCYFVSNSQKECLIFDPGSEGNKVIDFIGKKGLKPVAIMLTHAHLDHIGAVDEVRDKYQIPVYIHKNEQEWLTNPALNGSLHFVYGPIKARPAEFTISAEGKMTVGNFTFEVYETPGHSPGSLSFYFKEDGFVVSGDALFFGSIGRTDLPGGNYEQLLKSISDKLLVLPEDTKVLPGHGPITTVGMEMNSNPFLHGF